MKTTPFLLPGNADSVSGLVGWPVSRFANTSFQTFISSNLFIFVFFLQPANRPTGQQATHLFSVFFSSKTKNPLIYLPQYVIVLEITELEMISEFELKKVEDILLLQKDMLFAYLYGSEAKGVNLPR